MIIIISLIYINIFSDLRMGAPRHAPKIFGVIQTQADTKNTPPDDCFAPKVAVSTRENGRDFLNTCS